MSANKAGGYYGRAARLLGRALRFRLARMRAAPLKPEALSLAVTNRCNSRCVMCNMWRLSKEDPGMKGRELSGGEIIDLLARPLFSPLVELDLTGGEPHLRDDLADIALGAAALKKQYLPRLQSIVITSNGLLPERVVANYRQVLKGLRGSGIDLVSVASIDGIGGTHDRIRGTRGAFRLATGTLGGMLELRKEFPNYQVGLKTTVLPDNIDALGEILDFARERGLFHIISPAFFTETRFRNTERRDTLELGPDAPEKLLNFYNRRELYTGYFYSRIRAFLASGKKSWTCTAAYNYLFVEYEGTVYPCELLPEPIGSIREESPEAIWTGERAKHWRQRIGKAWPCRGCIEPGAVRYSAIAEGRSYLGFLRKLGRGKYTATLHGEGFTKYIDK